MGSCDDLVEDEGGPNDWQWLDRLLSVSHSAPMNSKVKYLLTGKSREGGHFSIELKTSSVGEVLRHEAEARAIQEIRRHEPCDDLATLNIRRLATRD
jgi:hypothetical protein